MKKRKKKCEILIDVKNITKTYQQGEVAVQALKGISIKINECDFLVIRGRNGSGKTTCLRQLGLLDIPTSGNIILEGEDVTKLSERKRTTLRLERIGYIFQEFALISELTAVENVMLPSMMISATDFSKKKAKKLLEKVGLKGKTNRLPSQLSGGEQQKVAVARSLINNPHLIIADEPTASLDSVAANDVLEIFGMLNIEDGHTVIMVTHENIDEKYETRTITLSDGNLTSDKDYNVLAKGK